MLDKNPETRITPKEALQSPFFTDEKVVGELLTFHDKKRKARYDRILKMANMNWLLLSLFFYSSVIKVVKNWKKKDHLKSIHYKPTPSP